MAEYEVQGTDENIDVRGELRKPGDIVELAPEDATELVELGVLKPREVDPHIVGDNNTPPAEAPASGVSVEEPHVAPEAEVTPLAEDTAGVATPTPAEAGSE